MASIAHLPGRHVIIDHRPGRYLSFPDVTRLPSGELLTVYREADQHVAGAEARLLWRQSRDDGRTWTDASMFGAGHGHCPRLCPLPDGRLTVLDDSTRSLYWFVPDSQSFEQHPYDGTEISLPDRLMVLAPDRWITAGHSHRGTYPHPTTRQPTSEEMTYLTTDEGASFVPLSVMAFDPFLVLCEASMVRLPEGRILALLRENSFVYEPMYAVVSDDEGQTWSLPRPTPLIGHRPTLGLSASGRLIATFRHVGPDPGTAAWIGTPDELLTDFAPAGRVPQPEHMSLGPEGLVIDNPSGPVCGARFALRPLTDPERATARMTATVRVDAADKEACGIRFGGLWWRLFPDRLEIDDHAPIPYEPGRFHDITLTYNRGNLTLAVDGVRRIRRRTDARAALTRPILFGTASVENDNAGCHVWREVTLATTEPRYERRYRWRWNWRDGRPDAWNQSHVLELDNDRFAAYGDFGYSGWVELPDGRFFCVYHHGGGNDPGYERNLSSHIRGAWFEPGDFSA